MVAQRKPPPDDDAIHLDLYERYGKPLEDEHWGKFVAVSPQGKTMLADTQLDALDMVIDILGPGSHIYKIGEIAVDKLHSPRHIVQPELPPTLLQPTTRKATTQL